MLSAILSPSLSTTACIYPTPHHRQDVTQGQFLSGVKMVWQGEVSTCHEFDTVCIYPTLLPWAECDTRSIFKLTRLVWMQSSPFPILIAQWRLKKTACPTILLISVGGNWWIKTFPKYISSRWNTNSFIYDLNSDRWFRFLWR